jgi:hypothetical protein
LLACWVEVKTVLFGSHQYNGSNARLQAFYGECPGWSFFHDKAPNWTVAVASFRDSKLLLWINLIVLFMHCGSSNFCSVLI